MKQDSSNGQKLHTALIECLATNEFGHPYEQCSRVCSESFFWVKDGQNECFSAKKTSGAFNVEHSKAVQGSACWLVCVDEGIVTHQKSTLVRGRSMARCDNLLFNDELFYYIEAKMNVQAGKWEDEFQDAMKNKIPATKAFILSKLSQTEQSIPQKICVAVNFPKSNNRVPQSNLQKQETLRLDAEKALGQKVFKLVLSETIML